jgi:hypothetical protein
LLSKKERKRLLIRKKINLVLNLLFFHMRGEYEELVYPFCEKGKIIALHFPSVWSFKRKSTETLPDRGTFRKSVQVWIIQSGCSVCGKSKEEVKKELKRRKWI